MRKHATGLCWMAQIDQISELIRPDKKKPIISQPASPLKIKKKGRKRGSKGGMEKREKRRRKKHNFLFPC